jgi:hypothetical protein
MLLGHVDKATDTAEEPIESSIKSSEGVGGSVGFYLPRTFQAIEIA